MFVDFFSGMLPFLALGTIGVANLVAASGALRSVRRAEELGEGHFELLRDQHERLELLREKRRMLLDELERKRRERLEAQERVKQLCGSTRTWSSSENSSSSVRRGAGVGERGTYAQPSRIASA
jgi:hypothetical protein